MLHVRNFFYFSRLFLNKILFTPTCQIVPHSIVTFALEDGVVLQYLLLEMCVMQNLASPLLVTKQTELIVTACICILASSKLNRIKVCSFVKSLPQLPLAISKAESVLNVLENSWETKRGCGYGV